MNVENQDGMKPGEARCPGPSTRDIIIAEKTETPVALTTESYTFLGDEDIPYERYYDPDFFKQEMDQMWTKVWQWTCREEHIPEPGDHMVYDIGKYSFLITRTEDMEIKAYYNSCLHRGTRLRVEDGSVNNFRCPFHGWEWNLDGTLKDIPCRWDFPHIKDEEFSLPEVQVGLWGGFVFINMDPDCEPLLDYLGVLPEHFKDWPLEDRYIELHLQRTLPCNWKAGAEAFLEAYHVYETHSEGLPTAGDANAQYDVFGDHVTRFIHTIGYQSPHWPEQQTEQQIFERMRGTETGIVLEEGQTARDVIAEMLRQELGEKYGVDHSKRSNSEMMDSIEYFCFPNMFMFPGISLPMIYRFRPNGMDPDSCLFDLLFLRPKSPGEEAPEPPEVVKLGIDEPYVSVPGMDPGLGFVYEQDTSNLLAQQEGFKASLKRGQTLGNYQEIRARKLHQMVDHYIAK